MSVKKNRFNRSDNIDMEIDVYLPTRTYGISEKEVLIVWKCKVRADTHYRILANVTQSTFYVCLITLLYDKN